VRDGHACKINGTTRAASSVLSASLTSRARAVQLILQGIPAACGSRHAVVVGYTAAWRQASHFHSGPGQVPVRSRSGPGQVLVRSRSGPGQAPSLSHFHSSARCAVELAVGSGELEVVVRARDEVRALLREEAVLDGADVVGCARDGRPEPLRGEG